MEKRESVGLVITVEINGVQYALLQERGVLDPEKLPKKLQQSWPGICQVSAHGTIEGGEKMFDALFREVREELGPSVTDAVGAPEVVLKVIAQEERGGEGIVTFTVSVQWEVLKEIPRGFSGLRLVNVAEAAEIQDATKIPDGKKLGAPDRHIWMFPDERAAVIKALQA